MFNPSPQQRDVFGWIRTQKGNAFIEAVAGAGKTTTLIESCKLMSGKVAFAAYNKAISDEISKKLTKQKLNQVKSQTLHSFGYGAVRNAYGPVQLDGYEKTKLMIEELGLPKKFQKIVPSLISYAKQSGMIEHAFSNHQNWQDLIEHYSLEDAFEDDIDVNDVIECSIEGLKWHRTHCDKIIDFDDMIWIPLVNGLDMWQYDWVLVDESQDLSKSRRMLVRKMVKPSGRVLFVGDERQAIYGFSGADSNSVESIKKEFRCICFPLTTTYRCPKSIVKEAQKYVSHIQSHPSSPEGTVGKIDYNDLWKQNLNHNDVVLCRKTKPLIEIAYEALRRKIPVHVEGRDIGSGLVNLLSKWKIQKFNDYMKKLEFYVGVQSQKLIALGKEVQADSLRDRMESIRILGSGCLTVNEVIDNIKRLFTDGSGKNLKTITLATVHRSKGREWDRVFLLGENSMMPLYYAKTDWQLQQEYNLIYVAYTRAKRELIRIDYNG